MAEVELRGMAVEEFAKSMGLSKPTVYRRIKDRSVRAVRIGRRWIIPRDELDRLLQVGDHAPASRDVETA